MKYQTGLIIGRFQPFHNGHLYLFQKALEVVDHIIVGVGSINIHDDKNPYRFEKVQEMLSSVVEKEGWNERIIQMFGIPDYHEDDPWREYIMKKSKKFDVIISHNDWVTEIFQKIRIPVIEISFYKRELYEGLKIRELMEKGNKWQDRVPECVVEIVSQ